MSEVINFLTLVLVSFVLVILGIGAVIIYFIKIKKTAAAEERVDDKNFRRADSTDYAKFKDIVSFAEDDSKSAMGMIAVDDKTFVGGIDIFGYNFYQASAEEQQNTMLNTIAFFNTIEEPVQMRQAVQPVDIEQNIEAERECARQTEQKIYALKEEYDHIVDLMENNTEDSEIYLALEKRLLRLMRSIKSLQWILKESNEMIYYMDYISNVASHPKKTHQLIFSYVHNPDEYESELTKEEIYLLAQRELEAKAKIYGTTISNCGCTWKPLSADDLTSLIRRHYHPITADDLRLDELMNSSYTSLYISSESLKELEIERRGEILMQQEMMEYERIKEQRLLEAQAKFEEEKRARIEEIIAMDAATA